MSIAVQGRLEMSGPAGDAVLADEGGRLRLSIDRVRTAMGLLALRGQLDRMTGIAPRLSGERWPDIDVEIHGWRMARLANGRVRPTLPVPRGKL